jgi:hypothetical protein
MAKADPAVLIDRLVAGGSLISSEEGDAWYLPHPRGTDPDHWKPPVKVKGRAFLHLLHDLDHTVPLVRRMARDIIDAVETAAAGHILPMVQWTGWAGAEGKMRYAVNPRFVVEISAEGIMALPNDGRVGALYIMHDDFTAISFAELSRALATATPAPRGIFEALLAELPPPPVTTPLNNADQMVYLLAWWSGLFVEPAATGRPLLGLVGGKGSGKTATGRMIGKLFYGDSFNVSGGVGGSRSVKDLAATAVHRPMMVADDQNDVPRETIDTLCRLATGSNLDLATFHETMALTTVSARASIAITSNRPAWALRDDLLDRMLPVRLGSVHDGPQRTDQDRIDRVLRLRTQAWAEGFRAVEAALRLPVPAAGHLTRFSDWEGWVRRMADAGGWLDNLQTAFLQLALSRVELAAFADPFVEALLYIARDLRHAPRYLTCAELYDAVVMRLGGGVSSDAASRPSSRALSNTRALGAFLSQIEREGSAAVDVIRGPSSSGAATYLITPKA